jgi:hypothetical protein
MSSQYIISTSTMVPVVSIFVKLPLQSQGEIDEIFAY